MTENPVSSVIRSTGLPALIEGTREFVEKLLGPATAEGGELLADVVRSYRWRNQLRILEKAQQLAVEARLDIRAVPLKTLVPLLELGGLEEDPVLQDMWAALLSNVASDPGDESNQTAFVHIMHQLGRCEAWVLSTYFVHNDLPLPTAARIENPALAREQHPYTSTQVTACVANLARLGLLNSDFGLHEDFRRFGEAVESLTDAEASESSRSMALSRVKSLRRGERSRSTYGITPLGYQFLAAVLPPKGR